MERLTPWKRKYNIECKCTCINLWPGFYQFHWWYILMPLLKLNEPKFSVETHNFVLKTLHLWTQMTGKCPPYNYRKLIWHKAKSIVHLVRIELTNCLQDKFDNWPILHGEMPEVIFLGGTYKGCMYQIEILEDCCANVSFGLFASNIST